MTKDNFNSSIKLDQTPSTHCTITIEVLNKMNFQMVFTFKVSLYANKFKNINHEELKIKKKKKIFKSQNIEDSQLYRILRHETPFLLRKPRNESPQF